MLAIEILSIAVVNYFTSSAEIFKPSTVQVTQTRHLLHYVHQNYIMAIELLLTKLPTDQAKLPVVTKL